MLRMAAPAMATLLAFCFRSAAGFGVPMRRAFRSLFGIALFGAGFFLAALPPSRAAADELIVISPHWQGIKDETARAFRAWHEQKYGPPAVIRWREVGGGT